MALFDLGILRRVSNGDVAKSGSLSLEGVKGKWLEVPLRPGPKGIEVTLITLRRYLLLLRPVAGREDSFAVDLEAVEARSLTITLEYWDEEAPVSEAKPLLVFEPQGAGATAATGAAAADWRRYKGAPRAAVTLRFSRRGEALESFGIRATSHQHHERRFRLRLRWDDTGEELNPHAPLCVFSRSKRFSRAKRPGGAAAGEEVDSDAEEGPPPPPPPAAAERAPLRSLPGLGAMLAEHESKLARLGPLMAGPAAAAVAAAAAAAAAAGCFPGAPGPVPFNRLQFSLDRLGPYPVAFTLPGADASPAAPPPADEEAPAGKRARGEPSPAPAPRGAFHRDVGPLLPEFRVWAASLPPSARVAAAGLEAADRLLAEVEGLRVARDRPDGPGPGGGDREISAAKTLLALYRPLSIPAGIRGAAALSARVQRGLPASALRITDEAVRSGVLPLVKDLFERGTEWLRRGGPRGPDPDAGLRGWRQLVEVLSDPRVLDTPLYATQAGRCLAFRAASAIRSVSRSHSVACSVAWTLVDALTHLADGPKTPEESRWVCEACWNVAQAFSDCNAISSPDLFLIGTDDLELLLDRALAVARAAAARDPELLATALYWRARGWRHLRRDKEAEGALEEALGTVARCGLAPSRIESALLHELYDLAWTLRRPAVALRAIADRLYWFTESEEDRLREAMTCVTLVKCAPAEASHTDMLHEATRARDILKSLPPEYGHCYMLNALLNVFSVHIFNRGYAEAVAVYREWVDHCTADPSRIASPNADWANFLRPVWARSYRTSEFYRLSRLLITLHRAVDPDDRCPVLPHLLFVYGDILLFDEQPAAAAAALSQSLTMYEQRFGDFFPPDSPRVRAVSRSLERARSLALAAPRPAGSAPGPRSSDSPLAPLSSPLRAS